MSHKNIPNDFLSKKEETLINARYLLSSMKSWQFINSLRPKDFIRLKCWGFKDNLIVVILYHSGEK